MSITLIYLKITKFILSLSDLNKFIASLVFTVVLTLILTNQNTKALNNELREAKQKIQDMETSDRVKTVNWERRDREKDSVFQRKIDNERTMFNDFIMKTINESKAAEKESNRKIERLTQKLMK